MASLAASRIASNSVRCSLCNYSVLNAFASACGAKLRQPETLRTLPGRMSRRRLVVPLSARQYSSHFIVKGTSREDEAIDTAATSRQTVEDIEKLEELEDDISALEDEVHELELKSTSTTGIEHEEMEAKSAADEGELYEEFDAEEEEEDGQPWYLGQDAVPPPPTKFVSPFIHPIPDVPPNSPPFMKDLFEHLTKDLGFSALSVMDMRGVHSATAMGGDLIVLICTARSPRHLHIGAEKAIRFMRANFHFRAHADGLIPKAELRLKERRRRRKGKILTAAEEEENVVRWVCIDTGKGVLIQVLTQEKRDELDLEGLLQKEIDRSDKHMVQGEMKVQEFLAINRDRSLADLEAADFIKDEPPVRLRAKHLNSVKRQNFLMYTRPWAVKGHVGGAMVTKRSFHWHSWSEVTSSSLGNPLEDAAGKLEHGDDEKIRRALALAVQGGDYEGIKRLVPKPWGRTESLMILETHLNHLRLVTRRSTSIALEELLSKDENDPWDSPFMKSFMEVYEMEATSAMHHAMVLLRIHAHFIERFEFPSTQFSRNVYPFELFASIPKAIRESGQKILPETYYLVLRALATSPALRPGKLIHTTGSQELTDSRLTAMLPIMEMMRMDGYDIANDVGVQSALFFAASPASTSVYMSELGDMNCPRTAKTVAGRTVVRQYDWRLKQFAKTRLDNNALMGSDAMADVRVDGLSPTVPTPLRAPKPTRNLPMLAMNPLANTSLANVPLPDATALVVYARAQDWNSFFAYYKSLLIHGFDIPPQMYSLIFQLVAKEGSPQHAVACLRTLWADLQRDKGEVVYDHGIAAGLVGCFRELKSVHSDLIYEFRELRESIGGYLKQNGMALTDEYGITEFFDGEYFHKGMIDLDNTHVPSAGPFTLVPPGEKDAGAGDFSADIKDLILGRSTTSDASDGESAGLAGDFGGIAGPSPDAEGVGVLRQPTAKEEEEFAAVWDIIYGEKEGEEVGEVTEELLLELSELSDLPELSELFSGTIDNVETTTKQILKSTLERNLKRSKFRRMAVEGSTEVNEAWLKEIIRKTKRAKAKARALNLIRKINLEPHPAWNLVIDHVSTDQITGTQREYLVVSDRVSKGELPILTLVESDRREREKEEPQPRMRMSSSSSQPRMRTYSSTGITPWSKRLRASFSRSVDLAREKASASIIRPVGPGDLPPFVGGRDVARNTQSTMRAKPPTPVKKAQPANVHASDRTLVRRQPIEAPTVPYARLRDSNRNIALSQLFTEVVLNDSDATANDSEPWPSVEDTAPTHRPRDFIHLQDIDRPVLRYVAPVVPLEYSDRIWRITNSPTPEETKPKSFEGKDEPRSFEREDKPRSWFGRKDKPRSFEGKDRKPSNRGRTDRSPRRENNTRMPLQDNVAGRGPPDETKPIYLEEWDRKPEYRENDEMVLDPYEGESKSRGRVRRGRDARSTGGAAAPRFLKPNSSTPPLPGDEKYTVSLHRDEDQLASTALTIRKTLQKNPNPDDHVVRRVDIPNRRARRRL